MTPQARISAAIELLEAGFASRSPFDRFVSSWLRARRFIGAGDRRAIMERVYAVMRRRRALDWWCTRLSDVAPDWRTRVIAAMVLSGGSTTAEVAALFDGSTYGPPVLTPAERALAGGLEGQGLDHPDQPLAIRANYPDWIEPFLRRRFGGHLEEEVMALNGAAPVDLRVNTLKARRAAARAQLAAEGVDTEPTPLSPLGLRLLGRRPLGASRCFSEGLIEVQDEGAQLASMLAGARPGMMVADYCAGAGGKALAMAARMENRGRILALDVSPRIARAAPRMARAGVSIVELVQIGEDGAADERAGRFDRVLADVPCTGTGTWRRDPARRWRMTRAEIDSLVAQQRRILEQAAKLVAPGGRFVYV
ncbi:MAG: RsmB/NOP family class I SAM-dependent RNA methyltransferase, partial [Alphaproteobacteria bacterium]